MSDKTIKVSELPAHLSKANIIDALSEFKIKKVKMEETCAYLLVEDGMKVEGIQFSSDSFIVPALAEVKIELVGDLIDWSQVPSQLYEIESLKSQKSQELIAAEYPVLQPEFNKKLTIRSCHPKKCLNFTQDYLLKQLFFQYPIQKITMPQTSEGNGIILLEFNQIFDQEKFVQFFQKIKEKQFGGQAQLLEESADFELKEVKDENEHILREFVDETQSAEKIKSKEMSRSLFFSLVLLFLLGYVILF